MLTTAEARFNQALALHQAGRLPEAERAYQQALATQPDHIGALHLLGVVALQTNRPQRGVELIAKAVALNNTIAEFHVNLGNGLIALNRLDDAIASFDRALALKPDLADTHAARGNALLDLNRPADALAAYDRALALRPNLAGAHNNRGNALQDLRRHAEAVAAYDRAIAHRPDYAEALANRGNALQHLKRYPDALASLDRSLALRPNHPHTLGRSLEAAQRICDWTRTAAIDLDRVTAPFPLLAARDDPALHLRAAEDCTHERPAPPPLCTGATWRHDRIRLAYLSADFHSHATAYLIAGLLERHDRGRFEIFGISFGPDDRSPMRARMLAAFEHFHDVHATGDREVAEQLHRLQIDIAIDLKGHTQDARPGILAHRPAPIQVSWLGYPGSMGADVIDYIIADPVVLPFDQREFYDEEIVHLPDSYQVNDRTRPIAPPPTRRDAGLPDHGFVFCSFNNVYKITPPVFDIWMRLLASVDASVLWLLRDTPAAEHNLRREAAARGIDPSRLVFADRQPIEQHLARHQLADLFLDTLPCNAHTTASDSLWAGLPVLTCQGHAFAGRVAASLLHASGLPDLVTDSLPAYEALALRLATTPTLLAALRDRLANNRLSCPLFDTDRFRRHLETAYETMWQLNQRGEPPRPFAVAPQPFSPPPSGPMHAASRSGEPP